MTRKHFAALAEALREQSPRVRMERGEYAFDLASDEYALQTLQWERDVRAIASACAIANSGFQYERFYRAAGYSVDPAGRLYR